MATPSTLPPTSSILFAPTEDSFNVPIRTKRERQLSRNSRPPNTPDITSSPSSPLPAAHPSSIAMATTDSNMTRSPSSSSSRLDSVQERSPSSTSILSLPFYLAPGSSGDDSFKSIRQSRLSKSRSMRNSSPSAMFPSRDSFLPSHHHMQPYAALSPERRLPSSFDDSSSMPRRWSNATTPSNRLSAGLASRLAEGASPYLRAGLDELKSIFDVDSDPIPISAMDEDDEACNEEQSNDDVSVFINDAGDDAITNVLHAADRSALERSQIGPGLHRVSSISNRGASPRSTSMSRKRGDSNTSLRAEDGTMDIGFSAAGLGINRGILGWCLAFIAAGLTMLCAYGYAKRESPTSSTSRFALLTLASPLTDSDTFSTTLIVFFLTQPGFALMGLIALILRRRALMDLFSRAMRAHVLAQACIVLLAYLDLSASSFYVDQSDEVKGSGHRDSFRMIPTMEMRFGPARGALQAGDTPGINLLYSTLGRGTVEKMDNSDHAHDSHVGDMKSRCIHLIVFLVQAALPILVMLIGQYIVAQRLAWLARRISVSRQSSSSRLSEKSSPSLSRRSTAIRRYDSKTLPSSGSAANGKLMTQLAKELNAAPISPINSRLGKSASLSTSRPKSHNRSLSQPLEMLMGSSTTERKSFSDDTILKAPLSDSPPSLD